MNNVSLRRCHRRGLTVASAIVAVLAALQASPMVEAASVSFSIVNPGPSQVSSDVPLFLDILVTADTDLKALSFEISKSGTPGAALTGRSADPVDPGTGLTFISSLSQIPSFQNALPQDFDTAGPVREVLFDLDGNGIAGGQDLLIETIEITPSGSGTLVLSLRDVSAATVLGAPGGVLFDVAEIDPLAAEVVLCVLPGGTGPDGDGDGQPDACDRP